MCHAEKTIELTFLSYQSRSSGCVFWYYYIRTLLRRDVLSTHSYPVSFIRWFVDKFEFQGRGTIHDHMLSQLAYMFLTKEGRKKKLEGGANYQWKEEDFVTVDIHPSKLSFYSSTRKLACLLIRRLWRRTKSLIKTYDKKLNDELRQVVQSRLCQIVEDVEMMHNSKDEEKLQGKLSIDVKTRELWEDYIVRLKRMLKIIET